MALFFSTSLNCAGLTDKLDLCALFFCLGEKYKNNDVYLIEISSMFFFKKRFGKKIKSKQNEREKSLFPYTCQKTFESKKKIPLVMFDSFFSSFLNIILHQMFSEI